METPETREGPRWLGEDVNHKLGRCGNAHLGEYGKKIHMARLRCGAQKCSGYAR